MERGEMSVRIRKIRSELEELLQAEAQEPCIRSNLEAALEHIELLYIELGLDVDLG